MSSRRNGRRRTTRAQARDEQRAQARATRRRAHVPLAARRRQMVAALALLLAVGALGASLGAQRAAQRQATLAAAAALSTAAVDPLDRLAAQVAGAATGDEEPIPDDPALLGAADRALLRAVFGIDDVARLARSDSGPEGVLLYEARARGCAGDDCRGATVRVGLTAPRAPGETWDAFVARLGREGVERWRRGARVHYSGLVSLDPEARPSFERMLADARAAGFRVRIAETYRSPARQAFLLARPDGRTETPTSVHSYGRAIDVIVGDGRIARRATARQWIAFRRWVLEHPAGPFRLVGTPERTWDWGHVELAEPVLGFHTLGSLVEAARRCRDEAADLREAARRCTVAPNLPPRIAAVARAAVAPPAGDEPIASVADVE